MIIGNSRPQALTKTLFLEKSRTIVLTGPSHVGKASFALQELESSVHPSDLFITPSGIDGIREALTFSRCCPLNSNQRTILVDDADSLSFPAQDALLKICEEPHSGLRLILVTHDLHSLQSPLRSRMRHIIEWDTLEFDDMMKFAETAPAVPSKILLELSGGRPGIYQTMVENAGFEELHEALKNSFFSKDLFLKSTPSVIKSLKGVGAIRDGVIQVLRFNARLTLDPYAGLPLLQYASILHNYPSVNSEIYWQRMALDLFNVT